MASLMRRLVIGLLSGCLLAGTAQAVDATYSYDALGRLVGVTYSCSAANAYAYDAAGNRTSASATTASGCPPVAVNDSVTTGTNTAATFDPRSNDSDPNGLALTITAAGTPGHGTAVVSGGAQITYTPTSGYAGADSFTYTITDSLGGTASATVSVTVSNSPPTAVNDSISTPLNTAKTFDPRANDSDPDGDALTITAAATPGHGGVTVNSGTSLTYTPTTGYTGSDSFTYTISDGHSHTATATVSVTVTGSANQPPVANNDSTSTVMNTAVTFDPRANDSDPDSDPLTITATGTPGHGSAAINAGTSLTYTPATSYTGTDSFTYTISDGHSHTATATVTVTITNAPVAPDTPEEYTAPPNPFIFDPRDYTYSGETLTITAVGTPGHGTATIGSGGTSITYNPGLAWSGTTTFTYTVTDGYGHSATGTITMIVDRNGN